MSTSTDHGTLEHRFPAIPNTQTDGRIHELILTVTGGTEHNAASQTLLAELMSEVFRAGHINSASLGVRPTFILQHGRTLLVEINESDITEPATEKPEHAIRAAELRMFTGISAAKLARLFGVSREQYQRWIKGANISSARAGQLVFLHNLALTVARNVEDAHLWWETPHVSYRNGLVATPYELLEAHEWEVVHDFIQSNVSADESFFGSELPLNRTLEEAEPTEPSAAPWSPFS